MSYIELKDVSFTYPNGNVALENVSLDLEKGERVAIIGQNGAGKTTMVKLINGLLKPSKGEIIIDGKNIRKLSAAKNSRQVGYSFQNPDDQIFNKDVYSEIAFGLKRMKVEKTELEDRVQAAARLCNLGRLLDENPYDLSLSKRKFVAIASVIVMDTKIVILDEPTAGQDKAGIECLAGIIDSLGRKGKTVVAISHDMEFVADNFKRCVVMAQKHKIADDGTKTVFWNPGILAEAKLKQPHISSLCNKLGIEERILSIDEFVRYVEAQCPNHNPPQKELNIEK